MVSVGDFQSSDEGSIPFTRSLCLYGSIPVTCTIL